MNPISKSNWLHVAELIDSYRVIPRVFLFACFVWTVDITHELLHWYMALSKEDRGIEASGFASVVFLTVFGFMKLVYSEYVKSGRDWNGITSTTEVVSASTTSTAKAAA